MIAHLTGLPRFQEAPGGGQFRHGFAPAVLDVDQCARRQPTLVQSRCHRRQQVRGVRRIEKHQIEGRGRMLQESLRAHAFHFGLTSTPLHQQGPQSRGRNRLLFDKDGRMGATRQGFETQCAGTCKQIQHTTAAETILQPVEQRFPDTIRRRTYVREGELPAATPPLTADDPQLAAARAARMAERRIAAGWTLIHWPRSLLHSRYNRPMSAESTQSAAPPARQGFFSRLKASLNRGSSSLARDLHQLLRGRQIDEALIEEIEARLLNADVGVEATGALLEQLRHRVERHELTDANALLNALRLQLAELLRPAQQALQTDRSKRPFVILVIGVNGSGKTTSIGKLARRLSDSGLKVMLAAGDTFRAAAIEQLEVWAQRTGSILLAQHEGADPAAVIFDAMQSAQARGVDVLLADTAGRLHSQSHLMEELKKVKRVIQRVMPDAPHEVLLVLDANQGQNALAQAEQFHAALGVTGLVITKLDGTARGGIVVAITRRLGLPIRFIGVGESAEDFDTFSADSFAAALIGESPANGAAP